MSTETIEVLLVKPMEKPQVIRMEDSLEAMQEVVGGLIEEYMPFIDPVAIVCNEEGKMRGLPLNRGIYDGNAEKFCQSDQGQDPDHHGGAGGLCHPGPAGKDRRQGRDGDRLHGDLLLLWHTARKKRLNSNLSSC